MTHTRADLEAKRCHGWRNTYGDGQCRLCWRKNKATYLGEAAPELRNHTAVPVKGVAPAWPVQPPRPKCIHLGSIIETASCCGSDKHVWDCAVHDRCKVYDWPSTPLACCESCGDYTDGVTDTVGVVLGSYNLPRLIELQVRLVRDRCGDVPILVVDDCSDGYGHTPGPETVCGRLRHLAATTPNVSLFIHPTRFGHASGDLSKVWTGLQWAKARGVRYLACLSQRLLIDIPRWLQRGAGDLRRSGHATASQPCTGRERFPIRSEAMILDVERWHTPAILDHLMPRKMTPIPGEWGVAAEFIYWDDVRDRLGGQLHPWCILNTDRYAAVPGIIWHCSHPPAAYAVIAQRYGLTLDAHFDCNGWRALEKGNYRG